MALSRASTERLIGIMARLRDPNGGCPWDLEQDFASIAPYTLEEAYEVADAIARNDMDDLKDELGDLLLQVVFHAQMAAEQKAFDFDDVVDAICDKMIRRHPHVFGDRQGETPDQVRANWDAIKAEEKSKKKPDAAAAGFFDDVPVNLPALTRAVKLQKRAAKVGFDWPAPRDVLDKLDEELAELQAEVEAGPAKIHKAEQELGDVLFVLANLARKLDLDPEKALRASNLKFIRRFAYIEQALDKQNKRPEDASLEEMDALWDEAKGLE